CGGKWRGRGACLGHVQVGEAKRTPKALACLEIRQGHVVAIWADHRNRHGSTPGEIALVSAWHNVPEDSTICVGSKRGKTNFLKKIGSGKISPRWLVRPEASQRRGSRGTFHFPRGVSRG